MSKSGSITRLATGADITSKVGNRGRQYSWQHSMASNGARSRVPRKADNSTSIRAGGANNIGRVEKKVAPRLPMGHQSSCSQIVDDFIIGSPFVNNGDGRVMVESHRNVLPDHIQSQRLHLLQ